MSKKSKAAAKAAKNNRRMRIGVKLLLGALAVLAIVGWTRGVSMGAPATAPATAPVTVNVVTPGAPAATPAKPAAPTLSEADAKKAVALAEKRYQALADAKSRAADRKIITDRIAGWTAAAEQARIRAAHAHDAVEAARLDKLAAEYDLRVVQTRGVLARFDVTGNPLST